MKVVTDLTGMARCILRSPDALDSECAQTLCCGLVVVVVVFVIVNVVMAAIANNELPRPVFTIEIAMIAQRQRYENSDGQEGSWGVRTASSMGMRHVEMGAMLRLRFVEMMRG